MAFWRLTTMMVLCSVIFFLCLCKIQTFFALLLCVNRAELLKLFGCSFRSSVCLSVCLCVHQPLELRMAESCSRWLWKKGVATRFSHRKRKWISFHFPIFCSCELFFAVVLILSVFSVAFKTYQMKCVRNWSKLFRILAHHHFSAAGWRLIMRPSSFVCNYCITL